MDTKQKRALQTFAAEIRLQTARAVAARGFGHLPGSLSVADAVAVLYGGVLRYRPEDPQWEGRDYVVMSKGHAGPTLYATLALKGFFPLEVLDSLNQPDTTLPSHCDKNKTPGIDATTGSLGQGASIAMGMALGAKLAGRDNRTYLFVGDGECEEGQVWEAFLFAAQQQLDNLVVFIDYNRKQLDGYVHEILDLGHLEAKLEAFGFAVHGIDGHDVEAISEALATAQETKGKPTCIVLHTVKGKGVRFIEEMELNHHITLTGDDASRALGELETALEALQGGETHV